MRFRKLEDAKLQAEANAKLTGERWIVFYDTNSQPNAERASNFTTLEHVTIVADYGSRERKRNA